MRTLVKKIVGVLFLGAVVTLIGCNGGVDKTNIEIIQNMMDQTSLKAQDWNPEHPDEPVMRVPPVGSVPRGYNPMREALVLDAEAAGRELVNPLGQNFSPEILNVGKEKYEIYCSVCHGHTGAGDGTVAEKMAIRPPSLLSEKINTYPDGRIYHVITNGQGVMGYYSSQIQRESDRWAIVNYVRTLQRKAQ